MRKRDLVREVAVASGSSQEVVRGVLDAMDDVVRKAIGAGSKVMLAGLGTLVVSRRRARPARNMRTGEVVQVPERNAVHLRASEGLLRAANGLA